jgi:hypothetical protein
VSGGRRETAKRAGGPVDLRLAGFAVAVWMSALAALYLSARAGLLRGTRGRPDRRYAAWRCFR